MGLVGIVLGIVGGLLGLAVIGGAVLYASDYRIDATVQQTHCERGEVEVKTKTLGIDHTVSGVPSQQCGALEAGNFVEYRVKSKRTTIFDAEGGQCIYDSVTGPSCGQSSFPL